MHRGLAISVVKSAALHGAAKALGTGIKGVWNAGGAIGHGLASGAGIDPMIGKAVGHALVPAAAVVGGAKLKQKKDQWMYQHGFYP